MYVSPSNYSRSPKKALSQRKTPRKFDKDNNTQETDLVSPKMTRRQSQELSEASPNLKSPKLTRRRSQEYTEDSPDLKSPELNRSRRRSQATIEEPSPQTTPKGDSKLKIIPEFEFDFVDDEPEHVVDECIKKLEQLKPSQMADVNKKKGWSPEQHAALYKVWKLTWHPTVEQKYTLAEKTGVPFENLRYYFDNYRRKYLKYWDRKTQGVKIEMKEKRTPMEHREKRTSMIVVNKESQEVVKKKLGRPKKEKICSTFTEETLVESKLTIEEIIENGDNLCLGVELDTTHNRCLLCSYKTKSQKGFHSHVKIHQFTALFCDGDAAENGVGCRKFFSEDTFDNHDCNNEAPEYFSLDIDDDLEEDNPALAAVAKLASEGLPACVAYEEDGISYCNLCDFTYTTRQNLYIHLDKHGVEYR